MPTNAVHEVMALAVGAIGVSAVVINYPLTLPQALLFTASWTGISACHIN